jgi:hypothetical protein
VLLAGLGPLDADGRFDRLAHDDIVADAARVASGS